MASQSEFCLANRLFGQKLSCGQLLFPLLLLYYLVSSCFCAFSFRRLAGLSLQALPWVTINLSLYCTKVVSWYTKRCLHRSDIVVALWPSITTPFFPSVVRNVVLWRCHSRWSSWVWLFEIKSSSSSRKRINWLCLVPIYYYTELFFRINTIYFFLY